MKIRKTFLASSVIAVLASSLMTVPAYAIDLIQIYKEALHNDSQFKSAQASKLAGDERVVQARANLLPNIGLSWNTSHTNTNIDLKSGQSVSNSSDGKSLSLSLTQPLFNMQAWHGYEQGKLGVLASDLQFASSQQDLMVRVAQAYFDVLAAENSLDTIQAQKKAVSEQLAAAKRNFEVGTATITDTHEAQSSFDLVTAQELAAQGDLEVKRYALRQIIGKDTGDLSRLKEGVQINSPAPTQMETWVKQAEDNNFQVALSKVNWDIAKNTIKLNRAGYYPTVGLSATTSRNTGSEVTGRAGVPANAIKPTTIGVGINIPLFSGLATDSRVKEAIALEDKARNDFEYAQRAAAQATRQAYVGVMSGLAQVKALEAAEISSQSALDSTKLGYSVGVRINIDVLNAQQKLANTKQSLARARYDAIVNSLRLKAAAGTLQEKDLEEVNTLLQK